MFGTFLRIASWLHQPTVAFLALRPTRGHRLRQVRMAQYSTVSATYRTHAPNGTRGGSLWQQAWGTNLACTSSGIPGLWRSLWTRRSSQSSSGRKKKMRRANSLVLQSLFHATTEESTIGGVVASFLEALPGCTVVVADNASGDMTAEIAREAGALVIAEPRQGKGFAIRRLLADVEADCYVMVDGDATYDPNTAISMVQLVLEQGVDMVNGKRIKGDGQTEAYRRGHEAGNATLTWIFQQLFRLPLQDTLSGYRAMSHRFVKSFPTGATGFEIEAELNAHAAVLGDPVREVPGIYRERPARIQQQTEHLPGRTKDHS